MQTLSEAREVVTAAAGRGGAITLVSPPGAAAYLGVGFFWELVEAVRGEFPGAEVEAVMDCGDDPGFALSALRVGFRSIVLGGNPRARARVAAIARAAGGRVLTRRPRARR